jgi:hypothetical protein
MSVTPNTLGKCSWNEKGYDNEGCGSGGRAGNNCQLLDPSGFGYPCSKETYNVDGQAWQDADNKFIRDILPAKLGRFAKTANGTDPEIVQKCSWACTEDGVNLLTLLPNAITDPYARITCLPNLSDKCLKCVDPGDPYKPDDPFGDTGQGDTVAGFRRVYSCARCRQQVRNTKTEAEGDIGTFQRQKDACCCSIAGAGGTTGDGNGNDNYKIGLIVLAVVLGLILIGGVIYFATGGRSKEPNA